MTINRMDENASGAIPAEDGSGECRNNDDALVQRIKDGDRDAWNELVARLTPLLWSIARRHGLSSHDASDAVQLTWLRCLEHIDQLSQAAALIAWLATICRRESMRLAARLGREEPLPEIDESLVWPPPSDWLSDPHEQVVRRERSRGLRRAVAGLPPRPRSVLEAMLDRSDDGYAELSQRLGIPIGSLGPTRQRALEKLREDPALVGLMTP